jgi:hypothetical protein
MKRVKIALWQWRCAKVVATGKTLSIHVFGQGPSAEIPPAQRGYRPILAELGAEVPNATQVD